MNKNKIVTTLKQVYLTCTVGGANKHYFYALVSEEYRGSTDHYVCTAWGGIGGGTRTNPAKRLPRHEESAVKSFETAVKQRLRKGYEKAKIKKREVPDDTLPSFWDQDLKTKKTLGKTTMKVKLKTKTEPEPMTRKDAPWAF
jgi:predicted DNA-binding WGR domain protein